MTDLARMALTVIEAFQALGNERFDADGATFVRNRTLPQIWDANHLAHITAATPDEIDRLLARAKREYAGSPYRHFMLDFTTPPAFEARLACDGYQHSDLLVMLLEGELVGEVKPHDIRPVTSDDDWNAYAALHRVDWDEYVDRLWTISDGWIASAMVQSRRAKSPPMRHWLAFVEGEPRAYCSSWSGPDGIGLVEDLFTHPDSRHRGLATALIHHCVAECRAQGAGPVVIAADPTDSPKHMYAAMGFHPVAMKRQYGKKVGA